MPGAPVAACACAGLLADVAGKGAVRAGDGAAAVAGAAVCEGAVRAEDGAGAIAGLAERDWLDGGAATFGDGEAADAFAGAAVVVANQV